MHRVEPPFAASKRTPWIAFERVEARTHFVRRVAQRDLGAGRLSPRREEPSVLFLAPCVAET